MKKTLTHLILTLLLCPIAFFYAVPIAIAAPPPLPAALKKLVQEFPPMEEAFRRAKWAKAQEHLNRISIHYANALPELLQAAVGPAQRKKASQFGFLLGNLKKQLMAQKRHQAEESFHLFGGLIIEFIEFFSYQEHPLLAVFAKKLGKMMKGAELDKILAEMSEMQSMLKRLEPSLIRRGVYQQKISATFQQLGRVQRAASAKNKKETVQQIKTLQQLILEII